MQACVHVAVAVVERADGRVLVAERDVARHQGGRLEFPGGKLEPGEDAATGLARELSEEVGIEIGASRPLIRVRHRYPERLVELHVRRVSDWAGEPHGAEGQALEWLEPSLLDPARFPEANRPIVAALQLPAAGVVTPAPADPGPETLRRFVTAAEAALAAGPKLLRLRAPGLAADDRARWVDAFAELAARHPDSRLLANAPPAWAARLPDGVGLHLSAADAATLDTRPVGPGRLLSCACHDAAELARAEALGADLACLGSVHSTPSHPGVSPLGWEGFSRLAAGTTLPLYAIGGVGPADLDTARDAGAVGVAGIRGFWPDT